MDLDNTSSTLFYPEFKSVGISPLFIGLNALKSTIAGIGILLNISLVLLTLISKSLHGSCNFLLAMNSLFSAIYLLSPFYALILTISGQNFVPLSQCFVFQFLPILGVNMVFGLMLFISVERAVSINFPIWFNRRNPKYYLPPPILFCLILSAANLYNLYGVQSAHIIVMCSLPDCYRGDPGQMLYRNGLLSICVTLACYVFIWFKMHRSVAKKNEKDLNSATRRMFKSLVVLISVMFFGWVVDIVVRLALPMIKLHSLLLLLVLSNVLSNCSFIAAGSNAIILYAFSKDYRGAYNSQLNRLFKYLGIEKWRMNSSIDVAAIVIPAPSSNPPGTKIVNNYGIAAGRSASISVVRPANGWPQQQQRTMRSVSLRDGNLAMRG